MDRLEFLKEMKNSLIKTVQSAFAPIVEEKIERIDRSIDVLSQVQWLYVTKQVNDKKSIETKYIDGKTLLLVHEHETIRAFVGTCPTCSQLLHVFQMEFTCKCINCDKYFSLTTNEIGDLQQFPMKKREDGYYIGLPKKGLYK